MHTRSQHMYIQEQDTGCPAFAIQLTRGGRESKRAASGEIQISTDDPIMEVPLQPLTPTIPHADHIKNGALLRVLLHVHCQFLFRNNSLTHSLTEMVKATLHRKAFFQEKLVDSHTQPSYSR